MELNLECAWEEVRKCMSQKMNHTDLETCAWTAKENINQSKAVEMFLLKKTIKSNETEESVEAKGILYISMNSVLPLEGRVTDAPWA